MMKNKTQILLLMIFFVSIPESFSQRASAFFDLGGSEKLWVLLHPFSAKKAFEISKNVEELSNSMAKAKLLDADEAGGKIDAFRHAYWMALMGKQLGEKRARWLGRAHEKTNRKQFEKGDLEEGFVPDKASREMDLHNNEIGISIARMYPDKSDEELKNIVMDFLKKGELLIIKKDNERNSLDSQGNVIPRRDWEGKWDNERVLVPSNYKFESEANSKSNSENRIRVR